MLELICKHQGCTKMVGIDSALEPGHCTTWHSWDAICLLVSEDIGLQVPCSSITRLEPLVGCSKHAPCWGDVAMPHTVSQCLGQSRTSLVCNTYYVSRAEMPMGRWRGLRGLGPRVT